MGDYYNIVAISRVRNEADIIEAFIRHNLNFVDLIIVVDDGSVDSTPEILHNLLEEGLALQLRKIEVFGDEREALYALLMRYAFVDLKAQWAVFLDADEFLEVKDDSTLKELLANAPQSVLKIDWNNFAWSPDSSSFPLNPVERLRFRQPPAPRHEKIIVPRTFGLSYSATPIHGKHGLYIDGKIIEATALDTVRLCHFPIRSIEQFTGKAVSTRLHYILSGLSDESLGIQYKDFFNMLLDNNSHLFGPFLEKLSRRYPPYDLERPDAEVVEEPLKYLGGDMRYAPSLCSPYISILNYSKRLAERIYVQHTKIVALEDDKRNLTAATERLYKFYVAGPLSGYVDSVSATGCISGWARDEIHVLIPVVIEAVIDSKVIASSHACLFREDLLQAGVGSGFYAFILETKLSVQALKSVKVRRKADGFELNNGSVFLEQIRDEYIGQEVAILT